MAQVSLDRLTQIVGKRKNTYCGVNQSYVAAALSNNWSDATLNKPLDEDYFHPGWADITYLKTARDYEIVRLTRSSHGEDLCIGKSMVTVNQIMKTIETTLSICGYLTVDLDLVFECECEYDRDNMDNYDYEHALIICQTDRDIKIVDSYINVRGTEIRNYQPELFKALLERPSTETWNAFCKSKEVIGHSTECCDSFNVRIQAINAIF